ncbi:MAG TPA: FAD-dependent thymidylate synthase [Bryobacteraceae bacterium]|nr:FAD-dependent thymidylate synthase [Bryobacteraceae bacterium]
MQIVKPYAKLMDVADESAGIALLRKIEWCGRISHRSEEAQGEDSWRRFIEAVVIGHGDWSIVEHASATVDALVDRGITHEWVRHRLFSYTQESTRFVNYEKKMPASFIQPEGLIAEPARAANGEPCELSPAQWWGHAISTAESAYKNLIGAGCPPQIARSVFPNALASRIIVTGNLRNWRHFFIMRTTKEAHPQMREVAIPLLAEFKAKIPILFDDIEPLAKQSESMKRMR